MSEADIDQGVVDSGFVTRISFIEDHEESFVHVTISSGNKSTEYKVSREGFYLKDLLGTIGKKYDIVTRDGTRKLHRSTLFSAVLLEFGFDQLGWWILTSADPSRLRVTTPDVYCLDVYKKLMGNGVDVKFNRQGLALVEALQASE